MVPRTDPPTPNPDTGGRSDALETGSVGAPVRAALRLSCPKRLRMPFLARPPRFLLAAAFASATAFTACAVGDEIDAVPVDLETGVFVDAGAQDVLVLPLPIAPVAKSDDSGAGPALQEDAAAPATDPGQMSEPPSSDDSSAASAPDTPPRLRSSMRRARPAKATRSPPRPPGAAATLRSTPAARTAATAGTTAGSRR